MFHDTPGLGARLIRLPGQLLLALVNATALLVIVACVLVLIVFGRVEYASERIAGTVTDAALSRLQVSPAEFKSKLISLDQRIEQLSKQLADADRQDHWEVTQQLKDLNENLSGLKAAAEGINASGPEVTKIAFEQAGRSLTDALYALRSCTPEEPTGTSES